MLICKSQPKEDIKDMKSLLLHDPCLALMEPCCTACARVLKLDSCGDVISETSAEHTDVYVKVAIVEVQSLGKPDWIKTCN